MKFKETFRGTVALLCILQVCLLSLASVFPEVHDWVFHGGTGSETECIRAACHDLITKMSLSSPIKKVTMTAPVRCACSRRVLLELKANPFHSKHPSLILNSLRVTQVSSESFAETILYELGHPHKVVSYANLGLIFSHRDASAFRSF